MIDNLDATTSTSRFEQTLAEQGEQQYVLRLYVAGSTARSTRAIRSMKAFCEEHLAGRCDLQVFDIYQQPELAKQDDIVAVPTLVRQLPAPLQIFIGDLADVDRVLVGLDMAKRPAEEQKQ